MVCHVTYLIHHIMYEHTFNFSVGFGNQIYCPGLENSVAVVIIFYFFLFCLGIMVLYK